MSSRYKMTGVPKAGQSNQIFLCWLCSINQQKNYYLFFLVLINVILECVHKRRSYVYSFI
jgi:hypothetical protein